MRFSPLFMSLFGFCLLMTTATATDIQTVKNGETPKGPSWTVKFTEDLRVGPDDGDDFFFHGMGNTVDADSRGRMYVTLPFEQKVMVIAPDGSLLKTIGGAGQGPGEFTKLTVFQVLGDDSLVAFEHKGATRSFHYFDKEGEFKERKDFQGLDRILTNAFLSPDGNLIASLYVSLDMQTQMMNLQSGILNKDLELKQKFAEYQAPSPNPARMGEAEYWAEFLGDNMKGAARGQIGYYAFGADGSVYTAVGHSYEITKWDSSMNKQMVFGRKYKPITYAEKELDNIVEPLVDGIRPNLPPPAQKLLTPAVLKKAIEHADFPPAKNPVNRLAMMGDKHVLVIHDANSVTYNSRFDIFDTQGKYKGHFDYKLKGFTSHMTLNFKQKFAYNLEEDEEGDTCLVRYRYELVKQ